MKKFMLLSFLIACGEKKEILGSCMVSDSFLCLDFANAPTGKTTTEVLTPHSTEFVCKDEWLGVYSEKTCEQLPSHPGLRVGVCELPATNGVVLTASLYQTGWTPMLAEQVCSQSGGTFE